MRRSNRLAVVLRMEQRREDSAREAMQAVQRKLESEEARLRELIEYHEDYQSQIRQQQSEVRSVQQLVGWQRFIAQLNLAIGQQEEQVRRMQVRLEEARGVWRAAWEKREAMAKHIEECRRQERLEADRHEQKLIDEAATLRYSRPRR